MEKIKNAAKRELRGWKITEILWLAVATAVILGLSLYWRDSVIGIISALTGVWCVILTGKGKCSAFIFGTVNVLLYAYIAYTAKYYGDVMLNLLYYFPTNFIGLYAWKKHMNNESGEVEMKKLNAKQNVILFVITAIGVGGYGLLLKRLGGNAPYIDATSTVLSVIAQILCIKRFAEQWIMWIVVDVVTVIMWVLAFVDGTESVSTLLMWIIYLINAVIMFVKWNKGAKKCVAM